MPILLALESDTWLLEIAGHLKDLPRFLPQSANSSLLVIGNATLKAYSRLNRELLNVELNAAIEPLFFENLDYDFYLTSKAGNKKIDLQLPVGAKFRHKTETVAHYSISFRNDLGFVEIIIDEEGTATKMRFEVFPIKLDYRTDYIAIRDEVTSIARSLAMTVQARTFGFATPVVSKDPTLVEWVALLRGYYSQYLRAANTIVANPHFRLQISETLKSPDKARSVNEKQLERKTRRPIARAVGTTSSGVLLPRKVNEAKRGITFDTLENRYIKFLLLDTLRKLQRIASVDRTGDEDADLTAEQSFFKAFRPEATTMLRQIQVVLRASCFQGIHAKLPPSLFSAVLQRHPAYSAFIRSATLLNSGLSFDGGPFQIGVKNVAQLYEYWCFLRLVRLFKENFLLEQQSIIQLRHLRLVVVLAKGKEAAINFRDSKSGKMLSLIYERMFNRLPTISQKPDNVIQLVSEERLHILDAKYRLSYDTDYENNYGGSGPTVEDINTMHRYRDAISIPHPFSENDFKRGIVKSAAVLFPYSNEKDYSGHKFFKSLYSVQIGGLPFLPGATGLTENYVRQLLHEEGYL